MGQNWGPSVLGDPAGGVRGWTGSLYICFLKKKKKPALKLVLTMMPVLGGPVVQPGACFRQLRRAKLSVVKGNRDVT